MGAPGLATRLWDGILRRHSLGCINVTFYPPGRQASISVSSSLRALSRHDWHWLYLQHLAETLRIIGEEHEAARLVVAARALAEDFVSSSYWPQVIGEKIPDVVAGAAEIIPERPGGTLLTVEVMRRGGETPTVRVGWSTPEARERVASFNLVLLVHVMRAAAHPLEQYELFKKIAMFAEYCERVGSCHDWATLRTGPLYAVVHADIAAAPVPPAPPTTCIAPLWTGPTRVHEEGGPGATPQTPQRSRPPQTTRRAWDRPGVAISAAAILWAGLVLGAYVVTREGPSLLRAPGSLTPAAVRPLPVSPRPRAAVPQPAPSQLARVPASSRAAAAPTAPSGDAERPWGATARAEGERGVLPRFRVVSGVLAREVAELRSKSLFDQGVVALVRAADDNLARIQYGAYRSREIAEEDARRIRAQGYSAMVVRW